MTTWHQLIRREVIFKEPSVVTADPLTLCRVVCGMGEVWLNRTLLVKLNRTFRIEFVVM